MLSALTDLKKAFGSGPDDAVDRRTRVDDTAQAQLQADPLHSMGPDQAGPRAQREPGSGLMSHPAIRFIRENRGWVLLGGAAIAVGLWLATTMSSGRRR